MLILLLFFYPIVVKEKMENARLEWQRKRRIMFGKWFKRKQYEIQNSLQNKAAESRKHRKIVISEKKKKSTHSLCNKYPTLPL